MMTTMTPPSVPSGFRRSICTQTSAYHARECGSSPAMTSVDAGAGAIVAITPPPTG